MSTRFEGGCSCGRVRYACRAEPELTFFCHCEACQKESGGPFSVELYLASDAVTIEGEMDGYSSLGDSGGKVTRKSCATCHSPIVLEMESDPEHVCIKAGSLDDASWISPEVHIYTATKQPWLNISDSLPQFEGDYEE